MSEEKSSPIRLLSFRRKFLSFLYLLFVHRSFLHSCIRSFMSSCIHSFIQSFVRVVYLFTHLCVTIGVYCTVVVIDTDANRYFTSFSVSSAVAVAGPQRRLASLPAEADERTRCMHAPLLRIEYLLPCLRHFHAVLEVECGQNTIGT